MKRFTGKAGFVISWFIIASMTISLIAFFSFAAELDKQVIFTYHLNQYPHEPYFLNQGIIVRVDLRDGMNRNEAIQVASALYHECVETYRYELQYAALGSEIHMSKALWSYWFVSLTWMDDDAHPAHPFDVIIDPTEKTINGSACYEPAFCK